MWGAVDHIETADPVDGHAETPLPHAERLVAAGDHDEAAAASVMALAITEARGNVVLMRQARRTVDPAAAPRPRRCRRGR